MISYILSHPLLFNSIRAVIAGDQRKTKQFVKDNLIKYCAKTVIDVGCGTGDFIKAVPHDVSYLGVDINKKYIDFARKNYQNNQIKFLLQDVTKKAFYKNRSFDAALFISMLHHLSDDELKQILPVIKKITRKVVIIADIIPDPESMLQKIMVRLDRGRFIRPSEEKVKILKKYFKVVKTEIILSRLAIQYGIICEI